MSDFVMTIRSDNCTRNLNLPAKKKERKTGGREEIETPITIRNWPNARAIQVNFNHLRIKASHTWKKSSQKSCFFFTTNRKLYESHRMRGKKDENRTWTLLFDRQRQWNEMKKSDNNNNKIIVHNSWITLTAPGVSLSLSSTSLPHVC